ncbi:hypothetical protein GGR51DRAFT_569259 [Nemania sp. FL0031]|nr:hypothetical protein GGR51DRAFT_569259 [Nemania sp. FL0031]
MPRKGFEKVRSGCITCKTRKVKCDEARPNCWRCRTSSRSCGGYRTLPPGSFSWKDLLKVPSTSPLTSNSIESRSLDFFRCVVAPALATPLGNSFWTRPVLQLAIQEPSTRHAVVAISSLYEHFDPFSYSSTLSDQHGASIYYYNMALRLVATSTTLSPEAVLLMSILFTCIEFLRGNVIAAIGHCRHGTHILKSTRQATPEISAIFRHLSIFPFFFGATLSDFPLLPDLDYPSHHIYDLRRATETLDCLMSKSVRLVRAFDPYRLGTVDLAQLPCSLALTQNQLCQDLDTWYTTFTSFIRGVGPNNEDRSTLRILEMRWHVCRVWVDIASYQDETLCDAYQDQFERIVTLAREDAIYRRRSAPGNPSLFKFEMALLPLLHFVVLKCRFLKVRLEALALVGAHGYARESLWDASLMYAIGRRMIEREHAIELPPQPTERGLERTYFDCALPRDDQRIRDSLLEDEMQFHVECGSAKMTRRRIAFFVPHHVQGKVRIARDWIYLPEKA